jgi:hypothetical protein
LRTITEIEQALKEAAKMGRYGDIAKLSQELKLAQEDAGKRGVAGPTGEKALAARLCSCFIGVLEPIIELGDLDFCEGVFFSWEFGDSPEVIFTKTAIRQRVDKRKKKKGQHGVHKLMTVDLVLKYGNLKSENGQTYRELYESNKDNNYRYQYIRLPLIKYVESLKEGGK